MGAQSDLITDFFFTIFVFGFFFIVFCYVKGVLRHSYEHQVIERTDDDDIPIATAIVAYEPADESEIAEIGIIIPD